MMRDSDTVARLGGDEFVILGEKIETDAEALALAERVVDTLKEPFVGGRGRGGDARERRRVGLARPGTPTPRACCARPTSRCIARSAPAGGVRRCSTRACAGR